MAPKKAEPERPHSHRNDNESNENTDNADELTPTRLHRPANATVSADPISTAPAHRSSDPASQDNVMSRVHSPTISTGGSEGGGGLPRDTPTSRGSEPNEPGGFTNSYAWTRDVYDRAVREANHDGEIAGQLLTDLGMIADWTQFALDHSHDPETPEEFLCPISNCLMEDPVLLPTGVSCSRRGLRYHLSWSTLCPETGAPLRMNSNSPFVANRPLRAAINLWCSKRQGNRSINRAITRMRSTTARLSVSSANQPRFSTNMQSSPYSGGGQGSGTGLDRSNSIHAAAGADSAPSRKAQYQHRRSSSIVISEAADDPGCSTLSNNELFRRAGVAQRSRYKPWVTVITALLSLAVTLNALLCGSGLADLDTNPFFGPSPIDFANCGLGISRRRVRDGSEAWLRLLAGPFLYAGVAHIAILLPCVISLMLPYEVRYGAERVALVVVISSYAGTLASPHLSPVRLTAPATTMFLSLAGMALSDLLLNAKHSLLTRMRWGAFIAMLPATGLVYSMISLPYIDAAGATIALASGFSLGFATFRPNKDSSCDLVSIVQLLFVLAAFFVLLLGVAALVQEPLALRMRKLFGCGETCAYCYDVGRFWTCEESRDEAPEQKTEFVVTR